jgi:hypothetical protein
LTYMMFEFAENSALSKWLHSDEVLGWSQHVQVALDVAGGLNYVHKYSKSRNILLDTCFHPKLTNFGLALVITADTEDEALWMTRHIVGTMHTHDSDGEQQRTRHTHARPHLR